MTEPKDTAPLSAEEEREMRARDRVWARGLGPNQRRSDAGTDRRALLHELDRLRSHLRDLLAQRDAVADALLHARTIMPGQFPSVNIRYGAWQELVRTHRKVRDVRADCGPGEPPNCPGCWAPSGTQCAPHCDKEPPP